VHRGSGNENSDEPRAWQEPGVGWGWIDVELAVLTASAGASGDALFFGGALRARALARRGTARAVLLADRVATAAGVVAGACVVVALSELVEQPAATQVRVSPVTALST